MSGKSALLLGATGAVGAPLLKQLLSSKYFTRVGEYGRRVTSREDLGDGTEKLEQKTIDFEKLSEAGLKEGKWDVVFITLGTTRAQAGSAAQFEKIDREYVINAARAARTDNPEHEQTVVYCSSGMADAKSHFPYFRSKGLTENGLAELGYEDTIIFRPGFLTNTRRRELRLAEKVAGVFMGLMSLVSSEAEIDVSLLATAMLKAGKIRSANLPTSTHAYKAGPENAPFTAIGNSGAIALAKADVLS